MHTKIISSQTGMGTTILTERGDEVRGARRVTIKLDVNEINQAMVELVGVDVSTYAETSFAVVHPAKGVLSIVKSIHFADGSVWSADPTPEAA